MSSVGRLEGRVVVRGASCVICREKARKGVMPGCLPRCLPALPLPLPACPALPCLPCLPACGLCFVALRGFDSCVFVGKWRSCGMLARICAGRVARPRRVLRPGCSPRCYECLLAPFPAKSARILVWRLFSVDEPDPICPWGAFPTRRARKSACRLIASLPLDAAGLRRALMQCSSGQEEVRGARQRVALYLGNCGGRGHGSAVVRPLAGRPLALACARAIAFGLCEQFRDSSQASGASQRVQRAPVALPAIRCWRRVGWPCTPWPFARPQPECHSVPCPSAFASSPWVWFSLTGGSASSVRAVRAWVRRRVFSFVLCAARGQRVLAGTEWTLCAPAGCASLLAWAPFGEAARAFVSDPRVGLGRACDPNPFYTAHARAAASARWCGCSRGCPLGLPWGWAAPARRSVGGAAGRGLAFWACARLGRLPG